jgi:MraZ protein
MLLLTGEYQHVIDKKGRVLIANKLRSQIDSESCGSDFYVVLGANGILCIYPERCYEQLISSMSPSGAAADEAVSFERMSFALSQKLELDSQGRLLLNEGLRKRAGLDEKVTLVGVRDHIEVWNSGSWEDYVQSHMSQYQKQMAEVRKNVLQHQSEI